MSKTLNIVTYFGGKSQALNWLLPLLPKGDYHFVDGMCGAANVALNVEYSLITINDVNDDVINLFYVLRENHEEFLRKLYFTPFGRKELENIINSKNTKDPIENARRYFVKCQLGYGANGSQNNHLGCGMEYTTYKSKYYRVDGWNTKLDRLVEIVEKLRHMQIESTDVVNLLKKVDREKTIIYLDPPYVLVTRSSKKRYKHEFTNEQHIELLEAANNVKHAYVAISGYENELYNEHLKDWYVTKGEPNKSNTGKREVTEVLWTNYDPRTVNGQLSLFEESIVKK